MIDYIANYCLRLSISHGISYLRASRDNDDTMLILRGVALSNLPYVLTQRVIWIPPDGVLWF